MIDATKIISSIDSKIETALEDDSPLEKLMLESDLAYFAERKLNMEINQHHEKWSELAAKHPRIAICAARDHGKSFMWCFAYSIWRAYHNWMPELGEEFKSIPRISLGYIFSNTQPQATDHLELIKQELETNEYLAHLLPDHKSLWSKKGVKLRNGAIIRARGWGVSVRGAHPCWIVCDDVLQEENLYSELTRNKEKDYLFSAVTPMLIPSGQLIVVGTPFHAEDLYNELEENERYIFGRYPALDDIGTPLWPTRYSKESLLERKQEIGTTRFTREYLVVPISDENSLFPESMTSACFDPQFEMPTELKKEDRKDIRVYTGVDLAMSTTVGADYTVITTLAVDQHQNRWIVDIRRKKGMGMTDQLREIQNVYQLYKPERIYIEDNNFQRVFKDELVRRTDMPVSGFTTTGYNKNSLERGVPSLQILFENRKFVIPRKTARDRTMTDILIHELKSFTWTDGKLQGLGAHDDMVMSLWIANEAVNASSFNFTFG